MVEGVPRIVVSPAFEGRNCED